MMVAVVMITIRRTMTSMVAMFSIVQGDDDPSLRRSSIPTQRCGNLFSYFLYGSWDCWNTNKHCGSFLKVQTSSFYTFPLLLYVQQVIFKNGPNLFNSEISLFTKKSSPTKGYKCKQDVGVACTCQLFVGLISYWISHYYQNACI